MKTYTKVVFLDIDGVITTYKSRAVAHRVRNNNRSPIVEELVHTLNTLHEKCTDVVYVLCSDWRTFGKLDDVRTVLRKDGFAGNIVDKTPQILCNIQYKREVEIILWIKAAEMNFLVDEDTRYCVIDDLAVVNKGVDNSCTYKGGLCDVSVRTVDGITEDDVQKVLQILNSVQTIDDAYYKELKEDPNYSELIENLFRDVDRSM